MEGTNRDIRIIIMLLRGTFDRLKLYHSQDGTPVQSFNAAGALQHGGQVGGWPDSVVLLDVDRFGFSCACRIRKGPSWRT